MCISKSHRSLCVSFSYTGAGLCIYHLLVWSNLDLLQISQWITLPTQACLVLYSFCANLLHSLIMWLIAPSLLLHSLHWQFCWVLSILALIWLVLLALSCAAIIIIIIIIVCLFWEFFTQSLADVFHLSLNGGKSPNSSRTLLSILAVLSNLVVWMVSTHLISMSANLCTDPLVTVSSAQVTIGIAVTFMFHSFSVL